MKMLLILTAIFSANLWAHLPHMDLEMETHEYQELNARLNSYKNRQADEPGIAEAIVLGERLSQWIKVINESRTAQNAIRLTSAETRRGIPIDKPNTYSPTIIANDTQVALGQMPESMRQVLQKQVDFPSSPGMRDEDFIHHARKIDRNYQSAVRYKSLKPYIPQYVQQAARDVRGFYYIVQNGIHEQHLEDVNKIPSSKVDVIKEALVMLCLNSFQQTSKCYKNLKSAFATNKLVPFFQEYFPKARTNWNKFFNIPKYAVREDIHWNDRTTFVPFNVPEIQRYVPYLRDNIQEEFRWEGWNLKLKFGNYPSGPRLKFVPGEVPHVNELGGNEIVMDSNQPIEEYESQWTIRHEFGHVLGLPDCYHEFYDTKLKAFVNYQLDTTDLMCSRAGNMNKRIYQELRRAYTDPTL